jgi:hypothetical protein
VNQVDQVTQSIAANAEESASASEELNSQAESLLENVQQLVKVIEGQRAKLAMEKKVQSDNSTNARGAEEGNSDKSHHTNGNTKQTKQEPNSQNNGVHSKEMEFDDF